MKYKLFATLSGVLIKIFVGFTQSSCLKVHLKRHRDDDKNSRLKEHIESNRVNDDKLFSSVDWMMEYKVIGWGKCTELMQKLWHLLENSISIV